MDEIRSEVDHLNELIAHVFQARNAMLRAWNIAGKKWPHEAEAQAIIRSIEKLDTALREEAGALHLREIRVKVEPKED